MDTRRNPFAPYAGVYPPELAGRGPILEMAEVLFDRTRNGFVGKNFIMYGLRGVGKILYGSKRYNGCGRGFYCTMDLRQFRDRMNELMTESSKTMNADADIM